MQIYGIKKQIGVDVNDDLMLLTEATTRSEIEFISAVKSDAYTVTTDNYEFNSTNEHPWLWIENRDQDNDLFLNSIIYSFNGGNDNHNRTLINKLYRNAPEPTDNRTELSTTNLNFGSVREPDIKAYSWDGSSTDGMEVDTTGLDVKNTLTSTVQAGTLVLSNLDGIVLPFGTKFLISFTPEEIGTASISAKIYFKKRE